MASLASPSGGDEAGPSAPPATPLAKLRPGRVWYWVALLVFLGGATWVAVGLVTLNNKIDSFQRVAIPGIGEVSLDHSGGYVIYYEGPGAADGNVPAFDVTVTAASALAAVESLETYSSGLSYSFGSREGRAVLTLGVAQPGWFVIEAPGAPAVSGGSSLAVGSSIGGDRAHRRACHGGHPWGDQWRDRDFLRTALTGQARPIASTFAESVESAQP
jgi:hypothetical protein